MNALDSTPRTHAEMAAQPAGSVRCPTGMAALDDLLGGGVMQGRVHEVYASNPDDTAGAAGFAALLAIGVFGRGGPLIWLRERRAAQAGGIIQAEGLVELCGTFPHHCLFVLAEGNIALLRASLDAARCIGPGVVVIEGQGRMPELDLTASRRLALAAEKSGVTLLLLRFGAKPVPSAAETRWSVASAPSRALAANAPGAPTFDIKLLRQRSGPAGMCWRLEWDRDQSIFRDTAISGAVVPVPLRRQAANTGTGSLRPFANRAA
jgi:protein ImuA